MTDREKFIALTDNNRILPSDAIVLLEGDGYNRVPKTIELFKGGYAKKIVFSGNIVDKNYGSFPFEWMTSLFENAEIPITEIFHENKSTNTLEQATEIIKLANELGWNKIILVASHYHQYRAFLTFLKQAMNQAPELIIFNATTENLPWFESNLWGKRIDLLEDEFSKIELYKQNGHLADYADALKYYEWRETQILALQSK